MEFLNTGLLWGTLLVSAPIIIHILNRQKYRRIEWAAMRFLREAIRKMRKRLRLEELLLLAMRCLIILLLALAIARPMLSGSLLGVKFEQDNFYAIVAIDVSASMGYKVGNLMLVDRARESAERIIGALKKGDKLSIILVSEHPTPLIGEPTVQFDEAKKELTGVKVSAYAGNTLNSFQYISKLMEKSPMHGKRIFYITDCQRHDWTKSEKESGELLAQLSEKAKISIIDVGEQQFANCTVRKLWPSSPVIAKGIPVMFNAEVTNNAEADEHGGGGPSDIGVSFYVEGNKQLTQTVSLKPGEDKLVSFSYTFQNMGPQKVWVEIDADPLMSDNIRYYAADVKERIDVLCIDGDPGMRSREAETFYLRFALNPQFEGDKAELTPIKATMSRGFDNVPAELQQFNTIVLANVQSIPDQFVAPLEKYVREGGGLVIFLGNRVDASDYNKKLYKEGKGLLPAFLEGVEGDSSHKKDVRMKSEDNVHPILFYFADNKRSIMSLIVYQYVRAKRDPKATNVKVLTSYNVPELHPAIMEKSLERGKVILYTTSCDLGWNELALNAEDFIPLMQETVRYVSAGSFLPSTGQVGETYNKVVPKDEVTKEVYVRLPSNETYLLPVMQDASGRYKMTFADTDQAGFYTIEKVQKESEKNHDIVGLYAANIDPEEGGLGRWNEDELREKFKDVKFEFLRGVETDAGAREKSGGKEIWRYLLIAAICIACLESFLAMLFGRAKS